MNTILNVKRGDLTVKLRLLYDFSKENANAKSEFAAYYDKYPIVNASVEEVNALLIEKGEIPIVLEGDRALIPATLVGRLVGAVVCNRDA